MDLRTCKFVFLILTVFAFVDSASASNSCADVFIQDSSKSESPAFPQDAVTLRKVQKEIQNSKDASDFFMSQIRAQSDAIKASADGKVIELDVLCLGAGPQCAAASLVLGKTAMSSMVLEKTDHVAKTFAEKDFFINSTELDALTMHNFPGGVGSLAHHTSQKYAFSSQLAAHIQAQQYASNVPVLLGTRLIGTRVIKVGKEDIIEITTDKGIIIRTRNFIVGTGLGEVGTKVRDEKYRKAFDNAYSLFQKNPDQIYPIMSTDTFLVALKNAKAAGKKIQLPKEIVLIGDGDGSKISIEGMSALELPVGFKLTWIGNTFNTPDQYLASRGGGDRYVHKIVPFYERGQITGKPGHVQTWEVLPGGQMRLTTADKETKEIHVADGQMIIDSTGYDNSVPGILGTMRAQTQLVDVLGPLPELKLASTVLARQAVDEKGKALPVYAVGAAAGPLGTKEELASSPNRNPIAIFNTVPRTSAFVSKLIDGPALESKRGARDMRESVVPASEMIAEAKAKRARQINRPVSKSVEATKAAKAS